MVETIVIEGPGASDSWIDKAESSSRVVILQLCFGDPETDHILGLRWISWRGCAQIKDSSRSFSARLSKDCCALDKGFE